MQHAAMAKFLDLPASPRTVAPTSLPLVPEEYQTHRENPVEPFSPSMSSASAAKEHFALDALTHAQPFRPEVPALFSHAPINAVPHVFLPSGNGQTAPSHVPDFWPSFGNPLDNGYGTMSEPPGSGGGGSGGDNGGTFTLDEGERKWFLFDTGIAAPHVWDFARINWGDGTVDEFAVGTGNWFPPSIGKDHSWGDNGEYTITARWWNMAGLSGGTTVHVSVRHVAPVVGVGFISPQFGVMTESEDPLGAEATIQATLLDPGWLDTVTLSVNWGDGSQPDTYVFGPEDNPNPPGYALYYLLNLSHRYLDDNPSGTAQDTYTITVNGSDDDGGQDVVTTPLTIQNVAPGLSADLSSSSCDEGEMVTLRVRTWDNPHDNHFLSISWGDGSTPVMLYDVPMTGQTGDPLLFTHVYVDDNPTATPEDQYSIHLVFKDDDLGEFVDENGAPGLTLPILVRNVAPTAELVNSGPVAPGEAVTVSFDNIQDPGADTFQFRFDWNGDGDFDDPGEGISSQSSATHTFSEVAVHTQA
jgi:hypothetical protein